MTKKSEPKPTILLVFKQEWMDAKKRQRLGVWLEVTREDYEYARLEDQEERCFKRRMKGSILTYANPGMVYEVETDGSDLIYPSSAKYVGKWKRDQDIVQWATEHRGFVIANHLETRMKKDKQIDHLLERLEPISQAYALARGRERDAILAAVIGRITRKA